MAHRLPIVVFDDVQGSVEDADPSHIPHGSECVVALIYPVIPGYDSDGIYLPHGVTGEDDVSDGHPVDEDVFPVVLVIITVFTVSEADVAILQTFPAYRVVSRPEEGYLPHQRVVVHHLVLIAVGVHRPQTESLECPVLYGVGQVGIIVIEAGFDPLYELLISV